MIPGINVSKTGENIKRLMRDKEIGDIISRQAAIDIVEFECGEWRGLARTIVKAIEQLPPAQPKRGKWIIDRSGAYCCSECMEPCAGYVMMKPRDKFCKMCGAKMEVNHESN